MNIQVKQTNHPKSAAAKGFNVKRRDHEAEWISVIPREDGLGIRIDLGETGSVVLDITDHAELIAFGKAIHQAACNVSRIKK